jgi:2-dehydro-3-deoxyphosphogluconate aldolase/(4S)-4-hydroxy-2-oxoglutarate aldolase
MTPTDLQAALKAGCKMVKFFPAMAAGGPNLLRNIAAPYAHTEIGFNPTGGVTLENLDQWLSMPTVRAVGGTWIATKADIANGDWAQITEKAKMSVDRAAKIRSAQ